MINEEVNPAGALEAEIERVKRSVRTDAYPMSVGELVNLYDSNELVIDPAFQRLFRWEIGQKSKLIESLLLGIPIPSIFVYERQDGTWELIDGLQRVSTLLEFMGKLRGSDGYVRPQSVLEATGYLQSLHNVVWEPTDEISDPPRDEQVPLGKAQQLTIKRARVGIEILKRPSDEDTKFDLFQRLNAGGTPANPQELRNCLILMASEPFFASLKLAADGTEFREVMDITEEQVEKQRHLELASRFAVEALVPYNRRLDIEEYIDKGIVSLAREQAADTVISLIARTFSLLCSVNGRDTLRRSHSEVPRGKVGLVGLEVIAVGVAKNLEEILRLPDPREFLRERIQSFWKSGESARFSMAGIRGTSRIQKTIPFGEAWFRPKAVS